ncbi:MAG: sulfotransferase [Rhodanobacter sp.]
MNPHDPLDSPNSLMADTADIYDDAIAACGRREWTRALRMASELLVRAPGHAGIHYIAGVACVELGRAAQAVGFLRRATTLDSTRPSFGAAYAKALMLSGDRDSAVREADRVANLLDASAALDTLGMIYALAHAHQKAAAMLKRAVAASPDNAICRFTLATTLIFLGDTAGAEIELEACLRSNPDYWKAYLALSQLRPQSITNNHVESLESVLARQAADNAEAAMYLHLALAKECEDLADYQRAFSHLRRGKQAGSIGRRYVFERDRELFDSIIEAIPVGQRADIGHPTAEPIFVIGMPRTGTTLVDRILSSHPDVQSVGELLNFAVAVKQQSGSRSPALIDPDTIAMSRHLDWYGLGKCYLSSTRPATGRHLRFVDKMPHNFLYAGHIARALPQAKIICLRRNPMDTCLSNFRQLFAADAPFFGYSFDLLDTGRYYLLFDQLIAHWRQALPGQFLEMDYEELVNMQEVASRKLMSFCGIAWDEACLHFERNASAVVTASAIQVRSAMYRDAMDRWKKYGSQLDELHELLASAGVIRTESR